MMRYEGAVAARVGVRYEGAVAARLGSVGDGERRCGGNGAGSVGGEEERRCGGNGEGSVGDEERRCGGNGGGSVGDEERRCGGNGGGSVGDEERRCGGNGGGSVGDDERRLKHVWRVAGGYLGLDVGVELKLVGCPGLCLHVNKHGIVGGRVGVSHRRRDQWRLGRR